MEGAEDFGIPWKPRLNVRELLEANPLNIPLYPGLGAGNKLKSASEMLNELQGMQKRLGLPVSGTGVGKS